MSLGFGSLEYQGVLDETSSKYAQYFLLEKSHQGWEGAESLVPGHSSFETRRQPLMCKAMMFHHVQASQRGPSLASVLPRKTVLISFLRLTASVLWAGIATEDSPAGEDPGWGSGFVFLTIPNASGSHLVVTTQVATGYELSLHSSHRHLHKTAGQPNAPAACFLGGGRACRHGPVPGQDFPFCCALLKWVLQASRTCF